MTSAYQPFSEPRRFGDYILHGQLGAGGMAKVYVGQERLSGRRVALKIPHGEFAQTEVGRRRFVNEMRFLAHLDHPNIVRCLACAEIEQQPVLVLELLEGRTLREVLQGEGALHWRRALSYALQIAKALHAAHTGPLPLIHRDLKPENVMCLGEQLKVMDFGIAKLLGDAVSTSTQPFGSLRYMSPEQLEAKPLDPRSDLFALGVLTWEMLVGHPPFRGASARAVYEQVSVSPAPPLPDSVRAQVPEGTVELLERLLAKQPEERPASAAVVVAWLESLLGLERSISDATQLQTSVPVIEPVADAPQRNVVGRAIDHLDGVAQEVEASLNRFARMTSAWIVRMLIGAALYFAAVGFIFGVPAFLGWVNCGTVEWWGADVSPGGWWNWTGPAVLLLIPVTALVFIRRAWAHRHPGRSKTPGNLFLGLGLFGLGIPVAITTMQCHGSQITPAQHYLGMTVGAVWLSVAISLITGAILSVLLHRHERNQAE